ncbi:hypothetical protein A3F66_02430 [candidate division TM6 bacterium RIFCSPHIGHO2_12_FULL_32_22]|nr:MAG: hypothetical protein A3F66_02430 [candidate division TM6 bacterium RIFCSPHIGHO2_12_FULL_32_22]
MSHIAKLSLIFFIKLSAYAEDDLLIAARDGNLESVKSALCRDANINCYDKESRDTPLIIAARNGHAHIVRLLLIMKADPLIKNYGSNTASTEAIGHGNIECAKLLLTYAPYCNMFTEGLMYAAENNNFAGVQFALQNRANIDRRKNSHTALMNNIKYIGIHRDFNIALLKLLISKKSALKTNNNGDTALMIAAQYPELDKHIARLLIENNNNLNHANHNKSTALHIATKNDARSTTKLLLQAGAEINALNSSCETPLILASKKNYTDIVKLLLNFGADIARTNSSGKTPFEIASKSECIEVANILLNAALQIDAVKENSLTQETLDTINNEISNYKFGILLRNLIKNDLNRSNMRIKFITCANRIASQFAKKSRVLQELRMMRCRGEFNLPEELLLKIYSDAFLEEYLKRKYPGIDWNLGIKMNSGSCERLFDIVKEEFYRLDYEPIPIIQKRYKTVKAIVNTEVPAIGDSTSCTTCNLI